MAYRILGDMHTHTLYSRHAYSTIAENVTAASERGLEIYGAADHFSAMLFPEVDVRNYQFFPNQVIWPRVWKGVTVLRACEVDILSLEGRLFGQDVPFDTTIVGHPLKHPSTLYEHVTGSLDYVVASVHNRDFADGASLVETTRMYTDVLEQKKVFILGHTGRSGVPYDLDEVLTCAKEFHKLIEINEHSFDGDASGKHRAACKKIAERCAELGVGISVDSDAHIAVDIGLYPRTTAMLEEIHFPEELIMDRGRDSFLGALEQAGLGVDL